MALSSNVSATRNPNMWSVAIQVQQAQGAFRVGQTVYAHFTSQAAAQADVQRFRGGTIYGPNGQTVTPTMNNAATPAARPAPASTAQSAVPANRGYGYSVRAAGRSWVFTAGNEAAALRCAQATGGSLVARTSAPDARYRGAWNPSGPTYR